MFSRASASTSARVKNEVSIPNGAGVDTKKLQYPHRLNFYERPPVEEITIEDFEVWAIDRLRGASLSPSRGVHPLNLGPAACKLTRS